MDRTAPSPGISSTAYRRGLFRECEPFDQGLMPTDGPHEIFYEICGNPTGKPCVILHGGPGGAVNPTMRRYFDPDKWKMVLFDQRGCGKSRPNASLEDNTTWSLIEDIERLRVHLGIEKWCVFGGSWGSTLSLAYAEAHPGRVTGLILRGIFLVTRAELQWFYQDGCSWIYPEAFAAFQRLIPIAERDDMISAYHRRLTGSDHGIQLEAARAWSMWEGSTLSLLPDADRVKRFGSDSYARAFARIECHYFVNGGFFARDGELLLEAKKLSGIPGIIVHGRYDVVTPVQSAWALHAAWPGSQLRIVPDAGHAMTESGVVHELVTATRQFCEPQVVA